MFTVLVVDDEPDVRFMVRLILERDGHRVLEANNGAAALQAIAQSPPDLLVTDLMMPVMSGQELITRLRADPGTAAIPILVVSSDTSPLDAGGAALRKPFTAGALRDRVNALLGKEDPL